MAPLNLVCCKRWTTLKRCESSTAHHSPLPLLASSLFLTSTSFARSNHFDSCVGGGGLLKICISSPLCWCVRVHKRPSTLDVYTLVQQAGLVRVHCAPVLLVLPLFMHMVSACVCMLAPSFQRVGGWFVSGYLIDYLCAYHRNSWRSFMSPARRYAHKVCAEKSGL